MHCSAHETLGFCTSFFISTPPASHKKGKKEKAFLCVDFNCRCFIRMKLRSSLYNPLCATYTCRGPGLLACSLDCQGHWARKLVVPGLSVHLGPASSILGAELWPSCCDSLYHCLCNMPLVPVCICLVFLLVYFSLLKLVPITKHVVLLDICSCFLEWLLCVSLEFQLTWVYEFIVWFTCLSHPGSGAFSFILLEVFILICKVLKFRAHFKILGWGEG